MLQGLWKEITCQIQKMQSSRERKLPTVAQKLLDSGIIVGLEGNPRMQQQDSDITTESETPDKLHCGPYPELLYCGTPSVTLQYSGGSLPLSASSSRSSSLQSVKSLPVFLRNEQDGASSTGTVEGNRNRISMLLKSVTVVMKPSEQRAMHLQVMTGKLLQNGCREEWILLQLSPCLKTRLLQKMLQAP